MTTREYTVERYVPGFSWTTGMIELAVRLTNGVEVPRDLSVCTLTATAKVGRKVVNLTQAVGITIGDDDLGHHCRVCVSLTPEQTASLGAGRLDIVVARESPLPRRPLVMASVIT